MPIGLSSGPARPTRRRAGSCYDDSKRGRYDTRIDETRLAAAIDNHEFLLAFQPIVRLDTGDPIGFEALLRWQAPSATSTGVLMPRDFMPLLEKTGMSVRVGHWVIEEACRQAADWNRRFPIGRRCSSPATSAPASWPASTSSPGCRTPSAASGVQPWQLCLDITENALRFNRTSAWAALRELKDQGVKLGLDDFGTGVSSLTYLREFTLDILRIDRTFIENVNLSREDQAIVKHVTGLAHDLGPGRRGRGRGERRPARCAAHPGRRPGPGLLLRPARRSPPRSRRSSIPSSRAGERGPRATSPSSSAATGRSSGPRRRGPPFGGVSLASDARPRRRNDRCGAAHRRCRRRGGRAGGHRGRHHAGPGRARRRRGRQGPLPPATSAAATA